MIKVGLMGLLSIGVAFLGSDWTQAEERRVLEDTPTRVSPDPSTDLTHQKTSSRRARGKVREKEADGTQAINRFNTADTIPKSVYRDEQTGQQYEVDTD